MTITADTKFLDTEGVNAVEKACNDLRLLWRENSKLDTGIDGSIEITLDGRASGKIVHVQVKSGKSYMASENAESFKCPIRVKHISYWRNFQTPVFLFVYDPETKHVYWVHMNYDSKWPRLFDQLSIQIPFSKACKVDQSFRRYLELLFAPGPSPRPKPLPTPQFGKVSAIIAGAIVIIGAVSGALTIEGSPPKIGTFGEWLGLSEATLRPGFVDGEFFWKVATYKIDFRSKENAPRKGELKIDDDRFVYCGAKVHITKQSGDSAFCISKANVKGIYFGAETKGQNSIVEGNLVVRYVRPLGFSRPHCETDEFGMSEAQWPSGVTCEDAL